MTVTAAEILDELGLALNYFAFIDEKWPGLFNVDFGGDREILTNLGMVQSIVHDLYEKVADEAGAV